MRAKNFLETLHLSAKLLRVGCGAGGVDVGGGRAAEVRALGVVGAVVGGENTCGGQSDPSAKWEGDAGEGEQVIG